MSEGAEGGGEIGGSGQRDGAGAEEWLRQCWGVWANFGALIALTGVEALAPLLLAEGQRSTELFLASVFTTGK